MINKAPSIIRSMFDRVAPRYDVINRILSMGIDQYWRKQVCRQINPSSIDHYVDLATGTGDLLIQVMQHHAQIKLATGIDLSDGMLAINAQKLAKYPFQNRVHLIQADLTETSLPDTSVQLITISFGIRNVADKQAALSEMARLLSPDGQLIILEFSLPKRVWFRFIYLLYFRKILPLVGGMISGDFGAYRYLNQSVESWISPETMLDLLRNSGLRQVNAIPMTMGIATLYCAKK